MSKLNFDTEDLMDSLIQNVKKDIKDYEDIVALASATDRQLFLGSITDGIGSEVNTWIRYFNDVDNRNNVPIEERKPIKIYVDSPGGNLTDTFTMVDTIAMSKTPVWTIAIGCCYSGGFFTFIAGHKRIAYPHASFLYHEGSTGQISDAGKFRNFADFYNTQMKQLKDHTLKYTDFSEEYYDEHVKDDLWMTAEEALEKGVCDEIAEEMC